MLDSFQKLNLMPKKLGLVKLKNELNSLDLRNTSLGRSGRHYADIVPTCFENITDVALKSCDLSDTLMDDVSA